jgi:hypothetical protein
MKVAALRFEYKVFVSFLGPVPRDAPHGFVEVPVERHSFPPPALARERPGDRFLQKVFRAARIECHRRKTQADEIRCAESFDRDTKFLRGWSFRWHSLVTYAPAPGS